MKIDPSIRRLMVAILTISILVVISSCGEKSDSSTTGNPQTTGTISGSVRGTTILVLDDDGMIVASDNTKGRVPDLDLDNDGMEESYSFIINDLPVGVRLRIYLVTNEGVFPMYFDHNGMETNVLSLSSATDINLGFIESTGDQALPETNPLKTVGVVPEGADVERKTISGAAIDDFAGTWKGDVPYLMADGESGTAQVTMTLSVNGDQLVGPMYESIEGWKVDLTGTESNGVFEFDLPPTEPITNPDCLNWDVRFTATLNETLDQMDLTGGGTFCGLGGGKAGSFSGFLTLK